MAVLHQADASDRATAANQHGALAYLDLEMAEAEHVSLAYFATTTFTSVGGSLLAEGMARELSGTELVTTPPTGMRLPVLRETRMPAVRGVLGPPASVVRCLEEVAAAIEAALVAWATVPAGH